MARTLPDALKWSPQQTQRNSRLLGIAAAVVIALLIGLLIVDRYRVANRDQSRATTGEQLRLARSGQLVRDIQRAQRGYILTGDETFLEPYEQGQSELPGIFGELQNGAPQVGPDAPQLVNLYVVTFDEWRTTVEDSIFQRRQGPLSAEAEQQVSVTGKGLFDQLVARENELQQYLQQRATSINLQFQQLYAASLLLLALVSATMIGTVTYSVGLVRRIGQFASLLQGRQDRVQSYNRVVTALNGPTEMQPLLQGVLPTLLEMVGAQAGVIYLLEQDLLQPALAVGLHRDDLPALRPGEGLPGAALQQNRTIAVADLPADTPYRIVSGIGAAPPKSIVNVPLRFGSQIQGALSVASVQAISDDDVQQLRLAASQLATAISNARAFEGLAAQSDALTTSNAEIARRLEESETLQEMGRELAKQRDLQNLLQLVCREARRLLRADFTAVATQIDGEGATRCVAIDGAQTTVPTTTVYPPHKGLPGRVIDQATPVVLSDMERDGEEVEFVIHVAERLQSSIGVPLFRKNQPIGALIVGYRHPQPITEEMLELCTALAAYASVAFENARLLTELSQERDLVRARARDLEVKNREVEQANRLKSEFVANMSHELRTPLNSILALSQILDDELDGPLNEEQHKQVAIIERNGQNLLRLINDILNLSKIESGKLELLPSTFTITDMLENVQTTVEPLVLPKHLQLVIETASDLPLLHTDENKLKQVLLNLLSNAAKFTERGTITVSARRGREVGGELGVPAPQWVTFEVADTGIGIASDDLPTIWEEFQQIDGSLSRRFEGTGLGLAIVRRLVGLLGGEIVARSVLHQGTVFILSIPAKLTDGAQVIERAPEQRKVLPEVPQPKRTEQGTKPVVLVVDDEPEVIYILEKYLRDDGYDIVVAQTGDEAITQARLLHPFAMTLDVMLPGRDGWEVIQELKSDASTADIPIIMLSMLDNRQLGYSLGVTDYLVKPVSRNDLLERLNQLRNGHPLQDVLVVDDDPIEQRVLSTTLRELGMDVTSCTNGVDALAWLETNTPDVITLDLMMPGMDGFTLLDEIKRRPALSQVPVLIITAKDITPEDRVRLNSHIAAIIQKGPRQRDEVLAEVHELLQRQRRKHGHTLEVANE